MFANRLLTATNAATNACATVSTKNSTRNYPTSFQHYPLLINTPPLHPPLTLNIGIQGYNQALCECDQYNFKQSSLCESCCPECWQELLILLVLFLNICIFLIIWAASFFSFLFSFSFNIPQDTFWQSDRSRVQNNFCHLCNTTCKINCNLHTSRMQMYWEEIWHQSSQK